jgi:hypothetical protein
LTAVKDRLYPRNVGIVSPYRHKRITSADAFLVDFGLFAAHASVGERACQSAGNCAGAGSCQGGGEPASSNQGPDAWNRHNAKAG